MSHSLKLLLAFASSLLIPSMGPAAQYDLSWWNFGGGASEGTSFTIDGTIGQPNTGRVTGGSYSLIGGFWSVVQELSCPALRTTRSGNNLIISWSGKTTVYQLQQTTMLLGNGIPTAWTSVSASPAMVNGEWCVTLPMGNVSQFFRLKLP